MLDVVEHRILASLGRVALAAGLGIVLLTAICVPLFGPTFCCRLNANESAAIATLKNIHAGQLRFRDAAEIDRNGDGRGEFGWFGELAGAVPRRGRSGPAATPLLSPAFAQLVDGRVARAGYLFQLWLPAWSSGWVGEGHAGAVDQAAAEVQFRCAAWPAREASGKRAFFVDAAGDVFACRNYDWHYCGTERPVPAEAAMAPATGANCEPAVQPLGPGDWILVQ